ncbi:hypothetical protein GCM10027047_16470 [Rhodococcus aerolatus]
MSTQHDPTGVAARHPRPGAAPGALAALVADPDRFTTDVWGRAALHTPATDLPGTAADLFSAAAVDELVATRGLRTPFLRVARNGQTLAERDFTAGGGVGATIADQLSDDKLLRLFADGATMVLQALHRTWAPVATFAQDLAAELGHPVQVNGYVTPPQSRGFDDHYDVHDVVVLQVAGTKHWRVRRPVHPAPLRDQPWTEHRAAVARAAEGPAEVDVVMHPGDTLYLPRGWLHSAVAMGGVSTHLTMGVHTWTRTSLLEQVVAEAVAALAQDPDMRSSLGVGVDVGDPRSVADDLELVRARLGRAVADVDGAAVAQRLARAARGAQRPSPVAPLATLAAAAELVAGTELVLREHVAPRVEPAEAGVVVRSRAGDVTLDAAEHAAAAPVLAGERVTAGELGLELARRLLLSGLVVRQ